MNTIKVQDELTQAYNILYRKGHIDDSPALSTQLMADRLLQIMECSYLPNLNAANIGSGPQILEATILEKFGRKQWKTPTDRERRKRLKKTFESFWIFTIDIADTPKLLVSNASQHPKNIAHLTADGSKLTRIPDGYLGLVYSNHAWDYIPDRKKALNELNRVLSINGMIVMNLHHAELLDTLLSSFRKYNGRAALEDFKQRGHIYDCPENIFKDFEAFGIELDNICLETDGLDKWWHIEGRKTANITES